MGTERFPEEDAYNQYLDRNNGSSNAFTDNESTTFYFDVNNSALPQAMDLFLSFFTCPLFSPDSVNREIQAVDNEHSKNLQSDVWRLSHLIEHLSFPDHPFHHYSRFSGPSFLVETGSKETLTLPTIRDRAVAFYQTYYTPSNMFLVVLSGYNGAMIREQVKDLFSIPAREAKEIPISVGRNHSLHHQTDVFPSGVLGSFYRVVSVGTTKTLRLVFPLPSQQKDTVANNMSILSSLLGHEGEGSILCKLRVR